MIVEKLDIDIDYERLVAEYNSLNIEKMLLENNKQISVQKRPNVQGKNELTDGTQSLVFDWDTYDETTGKAKLRKELVKETDFSEVCDFIKSTYTEEVIKKLQEKYGVVRGRYMISEMKSCLTIHRDSSKRMHIPIVTNENCFMVIEDSVYHLPYGSTYRVDTTVPHTAVNASSTRRTHLVFCLPK